MTSVPDVKDVNAGDPVLGTRHKLRVAMGSGVGTTVENYDFIGYGTAAALYFGTAFFPNSDPVAGTLPAFATLGIGFAVCPLGIIAGLYIRSRAEESPEFELAEEEGELVKNPLLTVLKNDGRNLLRPFGLRVAETAGYAVAITYVTSYLGSSNLASRSDTILAIVIAASCGFPATLLWGGLTDKIGRKPVYLFGTVAIVIFGIPMFLLLNTGQLALIFVVFVVAFGFCQNSLAGTQGSCFSELFNTNTRSSGASLAYQLCAVVSGFTAFWALSLFQAFGWVGPAVLFSVYGAVGLLAALATPETFGAARRTEIDALTRQSLLTGQGR